VLLEFQDRRTRYGDVSVLPTRAFFQGMAPGEEIHVHVDKGRTLVIRLVGVLEPDVEGRRAMSWS
jgi:pyruvate carboxylase